MKSCRVFSGSALALFCAHFDGACAQVITEFSDGITAGSQPYDITVGPDGNLWFTEFNGGNQIGRITPLGVLTEFGTGTGFFPAGITAGPDGNAWFAASGGKERGRPCAVPSCYHFHTTACRS